MAAPIQAPWRFPLVFMALAVCVLYLLFSSWRAYEDLLAAQRDRLHGERVLAVLARLTTEAMPDSSRALCVMGGAPIGDSAAPVADWRPSVAELRELFAGDGLQYERLSALSTALAEWQEIHVTPLARACAAGEKLGSGYVQSLVRVSQPTRVRIAAQLEALRSAETARREHRETRQQMASAAADRMFALLSLSTVVLAIAALLTVRSFSTRLAQAGRRLRRESTERGLAQEQLHDAQRRLRMVLEHIPDAVVAFDASGTIQWLNPAGELLFGRSRQSVGGHQISLLIPELLDELDWPVTQPQAELEGSSPLPWTARRSSMQGVRPNGDEFTFDATLVQTRVQGDRIGVAVCRDPSQAQLAERAQQQFVSIVTQQLRVPLTNIRSTLGLLADGTAGPLDAAAKRLVQSARDHGERVAQWVGDLLELERMRAGQVPLGMVAMDLAEAARLAVNGARPAAEQRRLRVVPEGQLPPMPVLADLAAVAAVLSRLVNCALAASPPETPVILELGTLHGQGRVRVIDAGPAVPSDPGARVFEPFGLRGNAGVGRRDGLELAICRATIEHMGGAIGVEPPQPARGAATGEGAVFWISLPLRAPGT